MTKRQCSDEDLNNNNNNNNNNNDKNNSLQQERFVIPRLEKPHNGNYHLLQTDKTINPNTNQPFSPQYYKLLTQRLTLPVHEKAVLLQEYIRENQVVLFVGETGSGKTTQVPQIISEMKFSGMIACTQPRRIAAISVAMRVAAEMDVQLGSIVGYHVRFESKMCDGTKLLYMTDGMLLREIFSDSNLSRFSVIIVDEAHERTVDTDILLGMLTRIAKKRPEFRIIVMSATLDMDKFKFFFVNAPLIEVKGRMYDVEVKYETEPVQDYIESCVNRVCDIHLNEPPGDILCFLTGEAEIERAILRTKAKLDQFLNNNNDKYNEKIMDVAILPLYGSLNMVDQQRVFYPNEKNERKIIFATNIAETSLTIDGIVYVVDSGYQKQSLYNSEIRVDFLLPTLISKASSEQRKGRAGRTKPGKCFRMYRQVDFLNFPDQTYPEVLRSSMINTVLLLLKLGVENPYQFSFIDPPSQESITDAYYQLSLFEAVDEDLKLTDFGKLMAEIPADACIARMLIRSSKYQCGADVAIIASMLEVGNVFTRPSRQSNEASQIHAIFQHPDGDHLTLFNIFHAFKRSNDSHRYCFDHFIRYQALSQATRVYNQLTQIMKKKEIPVVSTYNQEDGTVNSIALRKAILEGFFAQVAYKPPSEDRYKTVKDSQWVTLDHHSVCSKKKRPSWIVYDRLEFQGKKETFIRISSAIEPEWLPEVSKFYLDYAEFGDAEISHILRNLKGNSSVNSS